MAKKISVMLGLMLLGACAHLNDQVNAETTSSKTSRRPAQINSDPKIKFYSDDSAPLNHFNDIEKVVTDQMEDIVGCYDKILPENETVGYANNLFQVDFVVREDGSISLDKDLAKEKRSAWKKNPKEYVNNQKCLRKKFQKMHFPTFDSALDLSVTIEY